MTVFGVLLLVFALGAAVPASAQQRHVEVRITSVPGLDALVPVPDDNRPSAAAIALGRELFFDPILSADGSVSCASCHVPAHSFADSAPTSTGVTGEAGRRNVPTLVNAAWVRRLFWDGRAAALETQVLQPIEDPLEMGSRLDRVLARLRQHTHYDAAFRAAYGERASATLLARALASYVRTIMSGASAFDRFRAGELAALSDTALAGLRLFTGRANCATCHVGPTFSDDRFHNTGVAWRRGVPADSGRFAVTGDPQDIGAFRTPTLRDLVRTAPYMHDGSFATLEEVVEFYSAGGQANAALDAEIRPLALTAAERRALLAFLHALTGNVVDGVR